MIFRYKHNILQRKRNQRKHYISTGNRRPVHACRNVKKHTVQNQAEYRVNTKKMEPREENV